MNRFGLYGLAGVILIADQLSKWEVSRTLALGDNHDLLPILALTHVQNTGGAFSIFPGAAPLLAVAAALAAVAIVVYTLRARPPLPRLLSVALALPLGGALGNLADRLRLGHVVDFLDLHIGEHHWPIFNVADSAICIGVALLAIYFWRQPTVPASLPSPLVNEGTE